jgi:RNA polymerase sigma-70 factor (ECF subfamily)
MQTTPVTLLERLREPGAEQAWARFVDLYTPLLFAWAHQLGLGELSAAELIQNVLTTLTTRLREFSTASGTPFRSWLRKLMMDLWFEHCRRNMPTHTGDEPSVDTVDINNSAEEYRRILLPRALQLLRPDFDTATWQACWDHAVGGRSAVDIAAELKLSEAAVYAARYRVLQHLRQEMEGLID